MAHLMWLEAGEEHRQVFSEISHIARSLGHSIGELDLTGETPADWLGPADAFLLRTSGYVEQAGLDSAFRSALDSGKRILVMLRGTRANVWLEERFELAIIGERHFTLARWSDPAWEGRRDRDYIVARPASAMARYDLLAGVDRVVTVQPHPVVCFGRSRPLLGVRTAELITASDMPVPDEVTRAEDHVVAGMWSPPGSETPQAVVLGDGACLTDELLTSAPTGNRQFALNLVRWLAGRPSTVEVAQTVRRRVDEIETALTEMIVGILGSRHGREAWIRGLRPSTRDKLERERPGEPAEIAMNLFDKVNSIFADDELTEAIGLQPGLSRGKSKDAWRKLALVRNRVMHPDRLVDPLTASELATVDAFSEHTSERRRVWLDSLDDDPAA